MKLKIYDSSNVRSMRPPGTPCITIGKSGAFAINKAACLLLDIKAGVCLSMAHDEDEGDWYIYADINGIPVRKSNSQTEIGKEGAMIQSSYLAQVLRKSYELDFEGSFTIQIAPAPTENDGQLMHALLNSTIKDNSK